MSASIGDRIKRYEAVYDHSLTPRSPLLIRVDGRAFHTFLRGATRPFDQRVIDAMVYAAMRTSREMSGFKLAYLQSDECTFLLTDYDSLQSQGWFDYKLNKVVSISASCFTAAFNAQYGSTTAMFDSRAFTVPIDDVPNVFIWRQRDWERNSVQMLTRSVFSHKQCAGKKIPDMHEMLHGVGINWSDLPDQHKNGTFITREREYCHRKLNYEEIKGMIEVKDESDA